MTKCSLVVLGVVALAVVSVGCSGQDDKAAVRDAYVGDSVQDIQLAIQGGDVETIGSLLDEDPSLMELRDNMGKTLLHFAAIYNKPEVIQLLVDRGMDPNCVDGDGMTPLGALEESTFRAEDARKKLMELGGQS